MQGTLDGCDLKGVPDIGLTLLSLVWMIDYKQQGLFQYETLLSLDRVGN